MIRLILLPTVALLAACSSSVGGKNACKSNSDCRAGQICLEGDCATVCQRDADCAGGEICRNTVCVDGARTDAPRIERVNGDGTPDPVAGHAANHIANALVITGAKLEGATAELTGAQSWVLETTRSSDTELVAALPALLVAGNYTLRVFNSIGEDQAAVTVLQGEQGPPGQDANLSGDEIVARINLGSSQIAVAALHPDVVATGDPGLIAGARTTTLVATGGASRSLTLNGAPQALDSADGIQLVVIDLDTHQLRTGNSVTGPPFLHNFTMSQPLDGQNLASVIGELDEGSLVVLLSKGAPFAHLREWLPAAAGLGASRGAGTLSGSEGYVLIGQPGLGPGNGLEARTATTASLSTVVVDRALLGRRDQPRRNYVRSRGTGSASCAVTTAAGWSAWLTLTQLPARTLITSGGPVRLQANLWNYTQVDAQLEIRFILNRGLANEQALGACSRSRASGDISMHAALTCDTVKDLAAGAYTVELQYRCDDAGTEATTDVNIYCDAGYDACTFFAEEL